MESWKVFLLLAAMANANDYRYYDKSVPDLVDETAIFIHVMLDPCGDRCDNNSRNCNIARRMHNCFKTATTVEAKANCIGRNCLQPTTSCAMWRLTSCYRYCISRKC